MWLGLVSSAAPAVAAPLHSSWVSFSHTQFDGGFGSDGIEDYREVAVGPIDGRAMAARVRLSFDGTVTQSLAFTFRGSEFGDDSFCAGTFARPRVTLGLFGDRLARGTAGGGVNACGGIGESVSDSLSQAVSLSAEIGRSDPLFDIMFDGFPLELVFRDGNWWDLERNSFDAFVYVTGFTGTVTLEALDSTPVPEPAALGLLGVGALAVGLARRRGPVRTA